MEVLLTAHGIAVERGQRRVLKGVDLTIHRGEVIGIVGENGVGKSTVIDILSGDLQPSEGSMTLAGEPYRPESSDAARTAGVSVIEQDFRIPEDITLAQAIFRKTFMADRDPEELATHAQRIIDEARIAIDPRRPVSSLDRAEQATSEVLRVLAEEAQLVVFDEVATTLNDAEIAQLHYAARVLKSKGCAVVYIAHRLEEVRALADRIAVLRDGRIVETLESRSASVEQIAFAMLNRELPTPTRPTYPAASEPVMTVLGLRLDEGSPPIDFEIRSREILGIVGLRNSGAAELTEAIAGVHPVTIEEAKLAHVPISDLGQTGDLVVYLTGYSAEAELESISHLLSDDDDPEIIRMRAAADMARFLGLSTSNINNPVSTLSGGDQQKVAFAALPTEDAEVMVLDHPTRGVDIGAIDRLYDLMRRFADRGRGVVVHSNDLTEIVRVCHRVLVLRDREVVAELTNDMIDEDVLMSYAAPVNTPAPSGARAASGAA